MNPINADHRDLKLALKRRENDDCVVIAFA